MAETEKPQSDIINAKFMERGSGLQLLTVPLNVEVGQTVHIPGVNKFGNPYGNYRIMHVFNPGEGAMDKTAVGLKEAGAAKDKPRSNQNAAVTALQLQVQEQAKANAEANAVLMAAMAKLMEKLG